MGISFMLGFRAKKVNVMRWLLMSQETMNYVVYLQDCWIKRHALLNYLLMIILKLKFDKWNDR